MIFVETKTKNVGKNVMLGLGMASMLMFIGGVSNAASMMDSVTPKNPETAKIVSIDRFSKDFAHLLLRTDENGLPGPNQPVNFDKAPFITQGLSPEGQVARYYNFDVNTTAPAPIYVLFREGEDIPVKGQLNVVDVIPGDEGYNDFWRVHKVTVPADYVANTITELKQIMSAGLDIAKTDKLVNCPVVPDGSVATLRSGGESAELHSGWYKGQVVKYFTFEAKELTTAGSDEVPVSPIYVTFNVNPDKPNGGPASGFVVETNGTQTHNVLQTVPGSVGYSPLWSVNVYNNSDWDKVHNLQSIFKADILANGVATVNCPVVYVDSKIAKLELNQ